MLTGGPMFRGGTVTDLLLLTLSRADRLDSWFVTPFNEGSPRFSPDGRWVAYQSGESGTPQIYIRSFADKRV